jgi:hypothetical protein
MRLSVGKSGELFQMRSQSLLDTLNATNRDLYPAIYSNICILLTMPMWSTTRERSFSAIRRVKILPKVDYYQRMTVQLITYAYPVIHRHVQVGLNMIIDWLFINLGMWTTMNNLRWIKVERVTSIIHVFCYPFRH